MRDEDFEYQGRPYKSLSAIARAITGTRISTAEKINESYVGRVLRLTLLAPDIVEAILNGRQPARLQLKELFKGFPVGWREQAGRYLGSELTDCGLLAAGG